MRPGVSRPTSRLPSSFPQRSGKHWWEEGLNHSSADLRIHHRPGLEGAWARSGWGRTQEGTWQGRGQASPACWGWAAQSRAGMGRQENSAGGAGSSGGGRRARLRAHLAALSRFRRRMEVCGAKELRWGLQTWPGLRKAIGYTIPSAPTPSLHGLCSLHS